MIRVRTTLRVLALIGAALPAIAGHADLKGFMAKPEPDFSFEAPKVTRAAGGTVFDLQMVSQKWQGMLWKHRLQLFVPDGIQHPEFCALLNTGGNGSDSDMMLGLTLAKAAGTSFAILYNIPNQPLYGGKTEDALIVYTWQKFLETGDESWPLHFPMAKAVLKAMDVVQTITREPGRTPIKSFLVTGASKRGWTTWLVGASQDPRVKAIAPMVIDILNTKNQLKHQLEYYGAPSEEVGDYTAGGLLPVLSSEKGKRLMELEDPYSYRQILTLPKLIILGTNDAYWCVDSLNLYWDGLLGPKSVIYAPNSGHGLEDRMRVLATLSSFIRHTADDSAWPRPKWTWTAAGAGARLSLTSDIPMKEARFFTATAEKRDFRKSTFTSVPMSGGGKSYTATLNPPASGWSVGYGEAVYEIGGKRFTLCTQVRLAGSGK